MTVVVSNPSGIDRNTEMVELAHDAVVSRLSLGEDESFRIEDSKGSEVPYQVTHDGLVIFPATLRTGESQSFKITEGRPSEVTVRVCGDHYPKRVDDICWENELIGFRAYGFKEDKASGYDIFVKRNTDLPAIPEMYRRSFDPELKKVHKELKKTDKDSAARFLCDHISFHVDHGFGADCYGVGPTLGAGTAALRSPGRNFPRLEPEDQPGRAVCGGGPALCLRLRRLCGGHRLLCREEGGRGVGGRAP